MIHGGSVAAPLTPKARWTVLMWLAIVAGGGLSIANWAQPADHPRFLPAPLNTTAFVCAATAAVGALLMRLHHIMLNRLDVVATAAVAAAVEAATRSLREAPTQALRAVGTVPVPRGPGFEEGVEQGYYLGLGAKPDAKVLHIRRS